MGLRKDEVDVSIAQEASIHNFSFFSRHCTLRGSTAIRAEGIYIVHQATSVLAFLRSPSLHPS